MPVMQVSCEWFPRLPQRPKLEAGFLSSTHLQNTPPPHRWFLLFHVESTWYYFNATPSLPVPSICCTSWMDSTVISKRCLRDLKSSTGSWNWNVLFFFFFFFFGWWFSLVCFVMQDFWNVKNESLKMNANGGNLCEFARILNANVWIKLFRISKKKLCVCMTAAPMAILLWNWHCGKWHCGKVLASRSSNHQKLRLRLRIPSFHPQKKGSCS